MCAGTVPSEGAAPEPISGAPAEPIRSRRNPLVLRLRRLHDPRGRRQEDLLLLEGTHLLQEALRLGLSPRILLVTPAWLAAHPELAAAFPPGTPLRTASPEVIASAATTRHPDGVLLAVPPPAPPPAFAATDFVLALDRLQDPGNLGTLLRTALAAGVHRAWLAEGADPWQPKVLRASSGAALDLPLERMAAPELSARLQRARRAGLQVVATVVPGPGPRGGQPVLPYWHVDWTLPTVLLLGNEGAGLPAGLAAQADHRVTIPHSAAVESLNVAVAAAPLLLERRRQSIERATAP
jgi:TrmH family RNA methyltransferase